ncbi:nucleotidyltransferase family protein [Streptomyces sp. NPDC002838]|uniref:nucleotidyltransferase domain-containing protein n=1 Tax=Streptomyces sp. NPDC002838 TaxID=3154436 RepID=UPI003317A842
MKVEDKLLLWLARLDPDEDRIRACRKLLGEHAVDFDWGHFLDQAARHRVLPLIARNLLRHHLHLGDRGLALVPYQWLFESAYYGNRSRNRGLADAFGTVIRELTSAGIRYAVRKGPVVIERLYRDPGLRRMSDLDLLVEREAAPEIGSLLKSLGYSQGRVSENGQAVEEYSRTARIFWRMNVNNELPYVKMANVDHIQAFHVDLCLNIFQPLSESSVEVADLLDRRIGTVVCGENSYALALEDQFIDLCAHLHKEATTLFYIEEGTDLHVVKFLDVALSYADIQDRGAWPSVCRRVGDYHAERSVYYALHHASLLYPDLAPHAGFDELRPADCRYLDEFGELDGKPQKWSSSFLDRLFDAGRRLDARDVTSIPRL